MSDAKFPGVIAEKPSFFKTLYCIFAALEAALLGVWAQKKRGTRPKPDPPHGCLPLPLRVPKGGDRLLHRHDEAFVVVEVIKRALHPLHDFQMPRPQLLRPRTVCEPLRPVRLIFRLGHGRGRGVKPGG